MSISDIKQTLKEDAAAVCDSAYSIGRGIVHDAVWEVKHHPYRTAAIVLASGAALYATKGRSLRAAAEEVSVVSSGRALEGVALQSLKSAEPEALSLLKIAGVGGKSTGAAADAVTVPILKGRWAEATVSPVSLPAEHWISRNYMASKDGIVQVILNGERQGTGFFVDKTGLAVTNHHVVGSPLRSFEIALTDGSKYRARVVSVDPGSDLAVLKILNSGGREFNALKIGKSTSSASEQVVALGYPEKAQAVTASPGSYIKHELSLGSRSGMRGSVEYDMVAKAGNSGSPVLDREGNVTAVINKYSFQDQAYAPTAEHLRALVEATKSADVGSRYLVVRSNVGPSAPTLMDRILSGLGRGGKQETPGTSLAESIRITGTRTWLTARPPVVA